MFGREYCMKYWCEKAKKPMSMRTGRRDMTEKVMNTALNPINQTIVINFATVIYDLNCAVNICYIFP